MFNRRTVSLTLAVALTAGLGGCASTPVPLTLADTMARNPALSTFNGLLGQSGLASTLQGSGPWTVFAPNNEAFTRLPAKTLDELTKNPAKLKEVLSFHVIPAKLPASAVQNSNVPTLQGAGVALSKAGEFVTIEEAVVVQPDIAATNGLIHVIDSVLTPPHKK